MRLLARDRLIRTGEVDHAAWNYGGLLGFVSRRRFALALRLLPERSAKLLEIGYGSGVFVPALAARADQIFGVDVHDRAADVDAILRETGVTAQLVRAPAERLPFDDGTFDAIVAISTLEFVPDLTAAVREMARVLKPDGCAVVVTPGEGRLLDAALRVFTGRSASADFGDRRARVVPALLREMVQDRSLWFPASFPLPVYRALRLKVDPHRWAVV